MRHILRRSYQLVDYKRGVPRGIANQLDARAADSGIVFSADRPALCGQRGDGEFLPVPENRTNRPQNLAPQDEARRDVFDYI